MMYPLVNFSWTKKIVNVLGNQIGTPSKQKFVCSICGDQIRGEETYCEKCKREFRTKFFEIRK